MNYLPVDTISDITSLQQKLTRSSVRTSQKTHSISATKPTDVQFVPHRKHISSPQQNQPMFSSYLTGNTFRLRNKTNRDSVRTSQEKHFVSATKTNRDSVRTSQETHFVSTTKTNRDSFRTSQETHYFSATNTNRDSVRTSQQTHFVSATKP
jgi:hypothetical protein